MALVFDPTAKRIVLDTTSVSASQLWVAWIDWVVLSDNSKYLPAMSQVGGESLGSGLAIPPYIFLQNGWKVRPMELNHDLVITGNLFVEGGGVPVVKTLGTYQVNVSYTVPMQAQALVTSGSSVTAAEISSAVWAHSFANKLLTVAKFLGLK